MSDRAEIHYFLRVGFGKHSETCLTAGIHVGVITENVECVRSNATCGNVDNAGEKLSGDFVHIGDHKEKSL